MKKKRDIHVPPSPQLPSNHGVFMLVPHRLKPLSREEPPPPPPLVISGIGYLWHLQQTTPFSGLSPEIFPRLLPKNTPFPEKWEYTLS